MKLAILAIFISMASCVMKPLPTDVTILQKELTETRAKLESCQETSDILVNELNNYMQAVDAMRDACQ